jgi:type IV secretory pathway TraG/TraD family ATPase VirD4
MQHLAAIEHLAHQSNDEALSVRKWISEGRGVLFLPYQASEIASLRHIISTWMRLAIFEAMSRKEGDRRLWFVVDELDALGTIDGLKDALARLRKFGGRCVLGFQSIGQVRGTYGDTEAQTIVENCGNTLILRCSASERGGTAEFASRLIGKREVIRKQFSVSRPRRLLGFLRQTRTVMDQVTTEDAVMASEIEQLPDLSGFLKRASRPEWQRVTLARGN